MIRVFRSQIGYALVMNVMMICFCSHDVIEYIVRNYRKDRPRFSLYLSSQLLYGSVKVYKKQTMYLVGKWNANLIEKDYVEMGLRLKNLGSVL